MRTRWIGGVVVVCVVLGMAGCGGGSDADEAPTPTEDDAKAAVDSFLEIANGANPAQACMLLTEAYRERLAPPDGDCLESLRTITAFTGAGDRNTLDEKVIDRTTLDGPLAVVVLEDRVQGGNELPLRVVMDDEGTWLIDEIGTGAIVSQACIEEDQAVTAAVDEYLTDHAEYPPDAKALVPGYLDTPALNHEVRPDGSVHPTGACA